MARQGLPSKAPSLVKDPIQSGYVPVQTFLTTICCTIENVWNGRLGETNINVLEIDTVHFLLIIMSRKLHQNCWFLAKREGWIIVTSHRIRKPLFKDRLCWKGHFYPSARNMHVKRICIHGIQWKCTMEMIPTICLGKICHQKVKTSRQRKEILNNVSCRGAPSKCSPKDWLNLP